MTNPPAVLGNRPLFASRIPVTRPTLPAYDQLVQPIKDVLSSGMLTKGAYLAAFEEAVAAHLGVQHAVAVSSCTIGLVLACQALQVTGDVLVPSFTFMATVHPLRWVGASPVFVDIAPDSWNIDPRRAEAAVTARTTAIVAVHNFGNPAPIAELENLAQRRGLKLLFDAAHGFGSRYQGQPVGAFGDAEVFSLSPTKLLVAGEGGIVATNDDRLAEHVRIGREYGNPGDYASEFAGLNARLPELSAILGLRSLEQLEPNASARNRLAAIYRSRLGALPGILFQQVASGNRSSFKDFTVCFDEHTFGLSRDELAVALRAERIDTRKYHHPPVHTHRAYREVAGLAQDALQVTERLAQQCLTLPMWSHMEETMVETICTAVERIHLHAADVRMAVAAHAR